MTTTKPKKPRKKPIQYERFEQIAVMGWARWQKFGNGKVSDYLHHSPNGGSRNKKEASNIKLAGVMKGFPDLFLAIPKNGYHGLFIELKQKKARKSDVKDSQIAVLERFAKQGYYCTVCFGANQAIETIKNYLDGLENDK